ncbi:MFS transporter [Sulfurisphaera tokodaii]|uniref:MFS transporter n=2 Tax=Sulfurisphaera tokodaii TaxID=111955 RepID=Q96XT8_SULTO|nr:MFS transporter [Sulfurisphaera tokodaii]BAB67539.1 MFS transporter [Sulfurisphaera tokodaii str. 7]HII74076.1 MFS transporter [Sulfurisphaera tokodaii]
MKLSDIFKPLDQRNFDVWHIKSLLTTGMGVFTDGYDLSSIGIVLAMVLSSFGITSKSPDYTLWQSLVSGSALIGAAVGAIIFGILSNRGRKTFYGIDVALLSIGALLQAFVSTPLELVIVRGLLGLGVGADYVLSPMIMAEYSNAKDRGKLLAFGFGLMWGFGATTAAAIALGLEALSVPTNIIWRVVLVTGAIPSASVIYLRRKIPETPRYLARIKGDVEKFREVVRTLANTDIHVNKELKDINSFSSYFSKFWKTFLAACLLWFLFDIVAYSGILFGPTDIAKSIGINNSAIFQFVIEFGFTLPGGIIALLTLDRIGRKPMQTFGFFGMAISLLLFSLLKSSIPATTALILYGLQNLFSQAGPGSVSASGMLGVELAPTKVRGLVQSLTVASGRIGAALTAFVFPALFNTYGESFAVAFLSSVAFVAAVLTLIAVPETKGKPLEVSSQEDLIVQEI